MLLLNLSITDHVGDNYSLRTFLKQAISSETTILIGMVWVVYWLCWVVILVILSGMLCISISLSLLTNGIIISLKAIDINFRIEDVDG